MSQLTLSAQSRTTKGKAVKYLRNKGIVPVVVYGGDIDGGLPLQVDARELRKVVKSAGQTRLIDLNIDSGKSSYPVLVRAIDVHPTRRNIIHTDFLAVRFDQEVQTNVPVTLLGASPLAVSNAAILRKAVDYVTLKARPKSIPSELEVDVSHLERIGQRILVSDLNVSSDITFVTASNTLIALLAPPRRIAEEEVEGEEEAEESAAVEG